MTASDVNPKERGSRPADDIDETAEPLRVVADEDEDEDEQPILLMEEPSVPLMWRATAGGHWLWASPQWSAFTGVSQDASRETGWLAALHPDDRELAEAAWRDAGTDEPVSFHARLFDAAERRYRPCRMFAVSAPTGSDGAVEWLGTTSDLGPPIVGVSPERMMLAEMQHRVRNMLTVVRSVFARTIETGRDLDTVADHFRGRIDALARTQVALVQSAEGTVDLENLVRDELLSVGVVDGDAITIAGPDIGLVPETAELLGLALHELTTNAVKFGALSLPGAALLIEWTVGRRSDGKRLLTLTWTERGMPAIPVTPVHGGFGRELIEEALPYRLGAETSLEFRGGGVRCTIRLPLG